MNVNGIKNLFFDLDGTLVDSSIGITESTNYALKTHNEPIREINEINKFIGFPLEDMFSAFSDQPFSQFLPLFRTKAREVMVDSTVPLKNAETVIEILYNRGYNLSVGSTKITLHISGILKKLGWDRYIKNIAGADTVENVKPAPDVFLQLLGHVDGSTNDSIVIGDTTNDILAAKAASLRSIGIYSPYGHHDELKKSQPDLIIHQLDELLDIFEN